MSIGRKAKTAVPRAGAATEPELDSRALLSELADQALRLYGRQWEPQGETSGMSQDRLELIRRRIQDGYYNRPDVKHKIADKLIDDADREGGAGKDS